MPRNNIRRSHSVGSLWRKETGSGRKEQAQGGKGGLREEGGGSGSHRGISDLHEAAVKLPSEQENEQALFCHRGKLIFGRVLCDLTLKEEGQSRGVQASGYEETWSRPVPRLKA